MKQSIEIGTGILFFGILTILVGYVAGFIVAKINKPNLSPECADCKDWNKNYVMEITLFLTGAIIWLISYSIAKL
jgi:hypothetical protein